MRDYGVLDFDAGNARRLPLVDTTWQQVLDALSDYLQSLPGMGLKRAHASIKRIRSYDKVSAVDTLNKHDCSVP